MVPDRNHLTTPETPQFGAAIAAALLKLDMEALEYVIELDFVESDLLQDDPAQPLEKWWWHLGKIRRGEYPADLLPDHLREIYSGSSFAK